MSRGLYFILIVTLTFTCSWAKPQCPYANQVNSYYPSYRLPIPYGPIQMADGQQGMSVVTKTVEPSVQITEPVATTSQVVAPLYIKPVAIETKPAIQTYPAAIQSSSNYPAGSYPIGSHPFAQTYTATQAHTSAQIPIPVGTTCGQAVTAPVYSSIPQQQLQAPSSISIQPSSPCTQSRLIQPSCGGCPSSPCGSTAPCYSVNYKK